MFQDLARGGGDLIDVAHSRCVDIFYGHKLPQLCFKAVLPAKPLIYHSKEPLWVHQMGEGRGTLQYVGSTSLQVFCLQVTTKACT